MSEIATKFSNQIIQYSRFKLRSFFITSLACVQTGVNRGIVTQPGGMTTVAHATLCLYVTFYCVYTHESTSDLIEACRHEQHVPRVQLCINKVSATQTDFRDTWLKFHRKFYVEYTEKNLFMYSIMKTNCFFLFLPDDIFPP